MPEHPWDNQDVDDAFGEVAPAEDPEGPQECDLQLDDDWETIACPACGRAISELAECCPHCGEWVIRRSGPSGGRRLVYAVLALLLVVLLLIWLL